MEAVTQPATEQSADHPAQASILKDKSGPAAEPDYTHNQSSVEHYLARSEIIEATELKIQRKESETIPRNSTGHTLVKRLNQTKQNFAFQSVQSLATSPGIP